MDKAIKFKEYLDKILKISNIDEKNEEMITFLNNNKDMMIEKVNNNHLRFQGNTTIHSMARTIDERTKVIPNTNNDNQCYKYDDRVHILNPVTREAPYKIKEFLLSDECNPRVKEHFIHLFGDTYNNKENASGYTPKFYAEKCDSKFYEFMKKSDTDTNTNDDGDDGDDGDVKVIRIENEKSEPKNDTDVDQQSWFVKNIERKYLKPWGIAGKRKYKSRKTKKARKTRKSRKSRKTRKSRKSSQKKKQRRSHRR
jgi:hypothetical protein